MPIEKPPRNPLSVDYKPPKSIEYRVKDFDSQGRPETWITIAQAHNLDVKKLIDFNFKTNKPDEVNWYLRRNVGCNVPTPDGLNWTFSSSAKPGKIYLPIEQFDMTPIRVTGTKNVSPLALEFEGPSSPLDTIGKIFDGLQMLDIGLAIAGVAVGEVVMLGIGILTAPIAPFVLMGGPHEAALNELRKKLVLKGLSLGVVLTADGRSLKYIKDHGYFQQWPIYDVNYQQYGKQLQGIYNQALVAGIAHGRQFNSVASYNLFKFIGAQMTDYAKSEYIGNESQNWSSSKWDNYYRLAAAIYAQKIKLR